MVVRTLRFALALTATNMKASFALRGAFWLQALAMLLNNVFFFSIWWIFFHRFEEIRGWRVDDMAALFGVVVGGYGIAVLLFGGVRDLSRLIVEGDLDSLLTQPKSPLLQALTSRSVASGWGELATSLLFLAISGKLTLGTVPLALVAVLVSGAVFTATGVLIHSLAFWLGRIETLARQLWEFTITFSIYPRPLFGGALKLLLFTLIPAGFIGYLPVELLREFRWTGLVGALAGASLYVVLALVVFERGLRRYESGNRFGVRA
jgi:ABC-2 type transport system permease protein